MTKMKTQPDELLRSLGVRPYYKGYSYLLTALDMITDDTNLLSALTTKVYPHIAKCYHVTPTSVERAIRFIINKTWECSESKKLSKMFGPYMNDWTPTNREFLGITAECLLATTRMQIIENIRKGIKNNNDI